MFFATEMDGQQTGVMVGQLQSLYAFRDEYNTVARKQAPGPLHQKPRYFNHRTGRA
jgi:hypothetical protein